MANNLSITPGSGALAATDDVGGVHYQVVKLALGDEDVSTRVTAANPLPITGNITLSGTDRIGTVGANPPIVLRPLVVASTTAYTAGDVIGGRIVLTNAVLQSGGAAVWDSVVLTDDSNQKPPLTILMYNAQPVAATADNAAFAWGSGDLDRVVGKVNILAGDWETLGGNAVAAKGGLGFDVRAVGGQDLYLYVVTTGTPTFGTNADLRIGIGLSQA